jgi:hypothetical protein
MADGGSSDVSDGGDRQLGAGSLTIGQLADELHVHVRTVQRWHDQGTIRPGWVTEGGDLMWDLDDVRRQLDALHPARPSAPRHRRHGHSGLPFAGDRSDAPGHPDEPDLS